MISVEDRTRSGTTLEVRDGARGIIMIVPWLVMGGADKFNLSLVQQLTLRGWQVSIACTESGVDIWHEEFAQYTSDIFLLQHTLQLDEYPFFLRELIASRQPEIVFISNSELGYLLLPYFRTFCPAPIYIDYCHSEELHWREGGFPAISVQCKKFLDATLVASTHLQRWMEERGGEAERIFVRRVNVDTDYWFPDLAARLKVRKHYGIADSTTIIIYVARLSPEKLPLLFAETINALTARGFFFVTLIAGVGELKGDLEKYIETHALEDRVFFLGNVPVAKMPALMAASDILFLPSLYEGISLAVYEAMSCGLAVVTADVGGQRELVCKETGVLVQGGSNRASQSRYVEALACLLTNPAERRRMGHAARDRVLSEFCLAEMVDGFETICSHAVKNRRQNIPVLDESSADKSAIQAVEYIRAFGRNSVVFCSLNLPLKVRLYALLAKLLGPIYFYCLGRQWRWIIPIKDFIRKGMGIDG